MWPKNDEILSSEEDVDIVNEEVFITKKINQEKYMEENNKGSSDYEVNFNFSNIDVLNDIIKKKKKTLNKILTETKLYVLGNLRNIIFLLIINIFILIFLFIPKNTNETEIIFIYKKKYDISINKNCYEIYTLENSEIFSDTKDYCKYTKNLKIWLNLNNIYYNKNMITLFIIFLLLSFSYLYQLIIFYKTKNTINILKLINNIINFLKYLIISILILFFSLNFKSFFFIIFIIFNLLVIIEIIINLSIIYINNKNLIYYLNIIYNINLLFMFDIIYYGYSNKLDLYQSWIKYPIFIFFFNYLILLIFLVIKYIIINNKKDGDFFMNLKKYLLIYYTSNILFFLKVLFINYRTVNFKIFYIVWIILEIIIIIIYLIFFIKKFKLINIELENLKKNNFNKILNLKFSIPILSNNKSNYLKKKNKEKNKGKKMKENNLNENSKNKIFSQSDRAIKVAKFSNVSGFKIKTNKDIILQGKLEKFLKKNSLKLKVNKKKKISKKENLCFCCYNERANVVIFECLHAGICKNCAKQIWSKSEKCYICKSNIKLLFIIKELKKNNRIFNIITHVVLKKKDITRKFIE